MKVIMKVGFIVDLARKVPPLKQAIDDYTIDAIPLRKVKHAREKMEKEVFESLSDCGDDWFTADKVWECMEILDKLMESED
jgi:hypothetical protein